MCSSDSARPLIFFSAVRVLHSTVVFPSRESRLSLISSGHPVPELRLFPLKFKLIIVVLSLFNFAHPAGLKEPISIDSILLRSGFCLFPI